MKEISLWLKSRLMSCKLLNTASTFSSCSNNRSPSEGGDSQRVLHFNFFAEVFLRSPYIWKNLLMVLYLSIQTIQAGYIHPIFQEDFDCGYVAARYTWKRKFLQWYDFLGVASGPIEHINPERRVAGALDPTWRAHKCSNMLLARAASSCQGCTHFPANWKCSYRKKREINLVYLEIFFFVKFATPHHIIKPIFDLKTDWMNVQEKRFWQLLTSSLSRSIYTPDATIWNIYC